MKTANIYVFKKEKMLYATELSNGSKQLVSKSHARTQALARTTNTGCRPTARILFREGIPNIPALVRTIRSRVTKLELRVQVDGCWLQPSGISPPLVTCKLRLRAPRSMGRSLLTESIWIQNQLFFGSCARKRKTIECHSPIMFYFTWVLQGRKEIPITPRAVESVHKTSDSDSIFKSPTPTPSYKLNMC
jgi:hypothetical protein